ncbi:MAG: histidine phosphotransferase family protein [Pseudomonadota bacterium]
MSAANSAVANENQPISPSDFDGGGDDPFQIAALLASRLCHDLVNPVGALGSGLEVLEDTSADEGLRDAALELIKTGGEKSVALLKFARLAYGASGGRGAELPLEEAGQTMAEVFRWVKPSLEWRISPRHAKKEKVKTVMILTNFAADCVPRGGQVSVQSVDGGYKIEATGPRALLQDDLVAALAGGLDPQKPKFTPAYVAGMLTRSAGGTVTAERVSDEAVAFTVQYAE